MARVLITSGGTREPIDAVRCITNLSTGSTGAALADALVRRGHQVCLLHGEGAVRPSEVMERASFGSTEDLLARLTEQLSTGQFNAVIMCAAVSDYRPASAKGGKLRSDAPGLTLELVRTPKLLPRLRALSPKPLTVIGFKLTVGSTAEEARAAVKAQFSSAKVDAVIQNDLQEIRRAQVHPFHLYRHAGAEPELCHGSAQLALTLGALIDYRLP